MPFILSFSQIGRESGSEVGGKGANLGQMVRGGLPVPPGFVVTTEAYMRFLKNNRLEDEIKSALSGVNVDDLASLNSVSEKIRSMIMEARIPDFIERDIKEAYIQLSLGKEMKGVSGPALDMIKAGRGECMVAVRSSATSEDLAGASFAGQLESYLSIHGRGALFEAIKKCWTSLFTPRVIFYRKTKGFNDFPSMGVIVQRMIQAEKAGVMFTVNPMNKDASQMVIESSWGYGESIVSGLVTPDVHMIDKATGSVISRRIGRKKWLRRMDPLSGNVIKENVEQSRVNAETLLPAEVRKLWELGRRVEEYYGGEPQDIEWCIEKNRAFLVQTRPVTTLGSQTVQHGGEVGGDVLVTGFGASPGSAKGKVRLVADTTDASAIEQGEILVTRMTNPSMVLLMRKAAAIVTDEGGITCFSGETKILTNLGFRKIGEIHASHEGLMVPSLNRNTLKIEWKPIIAAIKRKSNTIEIETSQKGVMKGNILQLTPDHHMLTLKERKVTEKEIREILSDNDGLMIAQYLPAVGSSNEKDQKLAYLLGALLTDGHVMHNTRRGSINFIQKPTCDKIEFIKAVTGILEERTNKRVSVYPKKESCGFIRGKKAVGTASSHMVFSKQFAEYIDVQEQQLVGTLLNSDESLSYSLLAGVIDGDGCLCNNRISIYCSDESLLQSVIVACLRIGTIPQVTNNRTIYNVQIVEKLDEILKYTKRVKGDVRYRVPGTRLFNARQIIGDIVDDVNYKGRIKPYVNGNLLIDSRKVQGFLLPMVEGQVKEELMSLMNSDFRMLRTSKVRDVGIQDVYNITVQDNHNYIVFTDRYTPIIVNNCHASIVSRELGVPCIVGTGNATNVLKNGQEVTVDATNGKVYETKEGIPQTISQIPAEVSMDILDIPLQQAGMAAGRGEEIEKKQSEEFTATSIKANIAFPEAAERAAPKVDGVGLLRAEHMLAQSGKHPVMLARNDPEELIRIIEEGIGAIAKAFHPKPVWYRTLDARTDEFREMEGGGSEPQEPNPMLGWHGIRRSLDEPDVFRCELQAIRNLREKGLDNVCIMLPFIISVEELKRAKAMISFPVKVGIMVETPAAAALMEDFCREGIAFASIGSNDLTQLVLGVDRNNAKIAGLYTEFHPAVLATMRSIIRSCRKHNVEVSLCGESGSNPRMAEFLVEAGIDSISVEVDAIDSIRSTVAKTERKLLLNRLRG